MANIVNCEFVVFYANNKISMDSGQWEVCINLFFLHTGINDNYVLDETFRIESSIYYN